MNVAHHHHHHLALLLLTQQRTLLLTINNSTYTHFTSTHHTQILHLAEQFHTLLASLIRRVAHRLTINHHSFTHLHAKHTPTHHSHQQQHHSLAEVTTPELLTINTTTHPTRYTTNQPTPFHPHPPTRTHSRSTGFETTRPTDSPIHYSPFPTDSPPTPTTLNTTQHTHSRHITPALLTIHTTLHQTHTSPQQFKHTTLLIHTTHTHITLVQIL